MFLLLSKQSTKQQKHKIIIQISFYFLSRKLSSSFVFFFLARFIRVKTNFVFVRHVTWRCGDESNSAEEGGEELHNKRKKLGKNKSPSNFKFLRQSEQEKRILF